MISNEKIGGARFAATNDLIQRHLGHRSAVVEIGSNDASFRKFHQYRTWVTVDKYGCPDIHVDLDGDSIQLPFDSNSVDVVICTEVLEHLRIGSPLVAEICRILRVDGTAVISVPNICSLKSRVKMIFGRLPNMAASGDCGNELGGTGVLVDGTWVAGHVVDFNFARLRAYLDRGCLRISEARRVPITLCIGRSGNGVVLPRWMCPITLSDYILVAAKPRNK